MHNNETTGSDNVRLTGSRCFLRETYAKLLTPKTLNMVNLWCNSFFCFDENFKNIWLWLWLRFVCVCVCGWMATCLFIMFINTIFVSDSLHMYSSSLIRFSFATSAITGLIYGLFTVYFAWPPNALGNTAVLIALQFILSISRSLFPPWTPVKDDHIIKYLKDNPI